MDFLTAIKEQVIVIDGAMGTMIQDLELTDAEFGGEAYKMLSDLLTFSCPDKLEGIHLKYLHAGSNAVETNTFGASKLRLQEYNFKDLDIEVFDQYAKDIKIHDLNYDELTYHLNLRAAQIAKKAIETYKQDSSYDGRPLFALGSIGPSNWVISSTKANLNKASYQMISDNFYQQVLGLIDGGADVCLFETQQDALELKAAVHGAQAAMKERGKKLPIMAQITVDAFSKMQIFNTDVLAALTMLQGIGVDVFGINCSIGPDLMEKTVQKIAEYSQLPISVIPNAGLPVSEDGKTVFKLQPDELADYLVKFVTKYGVNIVGGCCGTRPAHIEAISKAMKSLKPKKREIKSEAMVSGPQNAVALDSKSQVIRIGERLNVRGSLKVRKAVESDGEIDFEALEEVSQEQIRDLGLEIIDVCMDSNLVNTEDTLVSVIKDVTTDFRGAMCIDSFSVEALLQAIEVYPGRPIINSISLEEYAPGVDKIDAVVAPTCKHDPVYIALATGPKGPAITAIEKADLAKQIYEKCHSKYGIRANQIIVDVNAFPIGSESDDDMNFAMESIKSIPLIKKVHPDLKVSMGVGNLTNGLAKKPYMRKVLTSVFMDEARKAGLDAAIINPNHYVPVESLDEGDVAIARKVILERDMDCFEKLEEIADAKKGVVKKKCVYEDLPLEQAICQKVKDGFKQRKAGTLQEGDFTYEYQDLIVLQVVEAIKKHAPLDFINKYLMAAMKELGDGFGLGEVSLPHLLKSADVMKHAMGYIEAYMKHKSGTDVHDEIQYKGTVVLGTVYQDVHSIGKDLVKTLLENYGYRVIDLGVQAPLESYIEQAKKYNAQAIGMSALLVQTSNHMITVAKMAKDEGLDVDILIGGAPVNNRHAAYVSMWGQDDVKEQLSNVFYCQSGMDGVNVMNQLLESDSKREEIVKENKEKLNWHYKQAVLQAQDTEKLLKTLSRRVVDVTEISRSNDLFFGPKKMQLTMKELLPDLDTKTLFSLNWRYGGKASWEKKGTSSDQLMEQLQLWSSRCDENAWLIPQAAFGIFPCQAADDEMIVYDPKDLSRELTRFSFSVIIGSDKKDIFSAAQFFKSQSSGEFDAIGLQVTTGGKQVDQQIQKFKDQGDSESALLLQGLSDRVAEDMADQIHQHLRKNIAASEKQGTRYSPGYPGLKDIEVNRKLAELLDVGELIDVSLTGAFEFDPTGTTGAVVCFHPKASYD
jgi:5-methyltetrahydrofolate--homocysteine methyltransferase